MDVQRGETGVPTTIEAQKQENVKKRAPSKRELDFRGIRELPNKLFRAFSRSSQVFSSVQPSPTSFFERLAVPSEVFPPFLGNPAQKPGANQAHLSEP